MVSQIYPSELQLNKANTSDTEAVFFDLHLSKSDTASTKNDDKRDDLDFEIVNYPWLYRVYISQLIRFARASSYVADFNTRNKLLTQKLLKQCYQYHKLRKPFLNFIDDTMIWYLNSKLDLNLSSAKDFRNLNSMVTWCINWKNFGSNNFLAQFIKIISHYKNSGYNINVLQQTASLVVNRITVGNFAFLFNCTPVGRTSDSMTVPTYLLRRW